ncbi:Domain of uncharacterised function (DUF397) [Mycobacterium tuberculosis]|nr:Domain of uncharacterised function (DUF397) [Mycobacterium tuberculosis]
MITWRKSSHSDETGGACVELARLPEAIAIRDSKAPDSGYLALTSQAFTALLTQAKHGELPR